MYSCLNCYSPVTYDIKTGLMKCCSCDCTYTPDEITARSVTFSFDMCSYVCEDCKNEFLRMKKTDSAICPYCNGRAVYKEIAPGKQLPEYMIPFSITREQCIHTLKKEAGFRFLISGKFKKDINSDKLQPLYLPGLLYDVTSQYVKQYAKKNSVTGKSEKTDVTDQKGYSADSNPDTAYRNIPFDASFAFNDALYDTIAPYNTSELKEVTPPLMCGFSVGIADADSEMFSPEAEKLAYDTTEEEKKEAGLKQKFNVNIAKNSSPKTEIKTFTTGKTQALLPVWMLPHRTKDRVTYSAINGQTGKASVSLPVSFLRLILFALIPAVPLTLLLLFAFHPFESLPYTLILLLNPILLLSYFSQYTTIKEEHAISEKTRTTSWKNIIKKYAKKINSPKKSPLIMFGVYAVILFFIIGVTALLSYMFSDEESGTIFFAYFSTIGFVFHFYLMLLQHSLLKKYKDKQIYADSVGYIITFITLSVSGFLILFAYTVPAYILLFTSCGALIYSVLRFIKCYNRLTCTSVFELTKKGKINE